MKHIQKGIVNTPYDLPYKWVETYEKLIRPYTLAATVYTPRFLVPITRDNTSFKVLVKASNRYQAMIIAGNHFIKDGWEIDTDYESYEEI